MNQKKSYTITETAQRLGITREAVFGAIKAGKLKATLEKVITRIWKIDPKSIEAYMVSVSHKERGKKSLDSLIALSYVPFIMWTDP